MIQFLLDENLSSETANFLNALGYSAKTVAQFGFGGADDRRIAELSARENRILVTLDLDFGEMYYFGIAGQLSIVILRIHDQTVEAVNRALRGLLESGMLGKKEVQGALIIVGERSIRIRKK